MMMLARLSKLVKPYAVKKGHNGNSITFYNGDCLDGMNTLIEEKSVDVVVTSPPYNIGIDYGEFADNLPNNVYLSWLERIGIEIKRVLKDDGSFFLNVGNKPSDQWKSIDLALRMRNHFVLQNKIQWVKSISIRNSNFSDRTDFQDIVTIGHHQPLPPTCARFLNSCYEDIYHFTKKGCIKLDKTSIGVPYKRKSNINRWPSVKQDLRDRGNVWFIPYDTIQNKSERPHPATFPIKLPLRTHPWDQSRCY